MGYSEFYCQLCGVSFNILFRLPSGEFDLPYDERGRKSAEPAVDETESVNSADEDSIAQDLDFISREEDEDDEPYEYDSDHESTDGMSLDGNDTSASEESSTDVQEDTEMQWYSDWVAKTFDARRSGLEEHIGYYDSPMSGYSLDAISPEQAKGCRTAQFLVHKSTATQPWQSDALHESWEVKGDWFLSGICDGIPSRDVDIPRVWPARNGMEDIEADNELPSYREGGPNGVAMPFHPWCFDIFCRQSKVQFQEINVSGLMMWRNSELDWDVFRSFPRTEEVNRAREQWWNHEDGSEHLVANPLFVPGLPALLRDAVREHIVSDSTSSHEVMKSSQVMKSCYTSRHTGKSDPFYYLPWEIRLLVIDYLCSDSINNLSRASLAFANLPNSVWHKLVRKEMPWLWEAWEESECMHTTLLWSKVSTAEMRSNLRESSHYAQVLMECSYSREDAQEAAVRRFPLPLAEPDEVKLPRANTDWHRVFTQIRLNWENLKGLQNRQRIWRDVEEVVRRIRKLEG
ncbi:uncharacterized protein N7515_008906 [Penicillium bovifimosum]|uniref:F-box domain-containing protein n=1 Tax=Penicillium bovifimosum TaxID=126998 RepID=A0A9W9KY65_9EURO|nr:uncharacterized protein N7515_008906 [Penicillium bovifimosum]KAJ5125081.1 hypothetical protein N7515_008906 [Penicillium bovifimosum]